MPIRWTAELDQLFLLKILESQNIKVDYKAVADSWPGTEKPTAKALSEHLAKLKKTANSVSEASAGSPASASAKKSTPRTPATKKTKAAGTSARKRKTTKDMSDDDSEDDFFGTGKHTVKKQTRTPRSAAKGAAKVIAAVAAEEHADSNVGESGSDFNLSTPGDPECESDSIIVKKEPVHDDDCINNEMGTGANEPMYNEPVDVMVMLGSTHAFVAVNHMEEAI